MSRIEKVKEIMEIGENFHMCDVSEVRILPTTLEIIVIKTNVPHSCKD